MLLKIPSSGGRLGGKSANNSSTLKFTSLFLRVLKSTVTAHVCPVLSLKLGFKSHPNKQQRLPCKARDKPFGELPVFFDIASSLVATSTETPD
jgi:hypothetical protein